METLPFVDDQSVEVARPVEAVWDSVRSWADRPARGLVRRYARLVGVTAGGGRLFDVERTERPVLLVLAGRHRFARYRLTVTLVASGPSRTRLTASTHAAFPGLLGSAYRTAVIRTGAHAVVTRALLRRIAG